MELLANEYTEYYIDTEEFGTYECHWSSMEAAVEGVAVLRREGVQGDIFIMRREVAEYVISEYLDDE